jgi:phosphoglycolate phosphatase
MSFRAAIFDLDGTLLNTLEDIAAAANRVLSDLGLPGHPIDDYRYFVGDGVPKLMSRVLPADRRQEETIAACVKAFRLDYGHNWNVRTRPYDGIPEMLDQLSSRGLKLAVLSNKPDDVTKLCVRDILPAWRFEVVRGWIEGGPRKPDPASAIEIALQLNLPREEILYVGDTAVDMRTAERAGMFGVGALWGFRTREELEENGARAVVERPEQVLDLV